LRVASALLALTALAAFLVVSRAGPTIPEARGIATALRIHHAPSSSNTTASTFSSASIAYSDEGLVDPSRDEFGDVAVPESTDPVGATAAGTGASDKDSSQSVVVTAPSSSEDESTHAENVELTDGAHAETTSQEAHADWDGSACAGDAALADASGQASSPTVGASASGATDRPVVALALSGAEPAELSSRSSTTVLRRAGRVGLRTETRQRFSPIVIARELNDVVIEPLGEWVLAAEADGGEGGAHVEYFVDGADPAGPAVKITSGDSRVIVSVQQVMRNDAPSVVRIAPGVEVRVGSPHRTAEIGESDDAPLIKEDGTEAQTAVDVVRVLLSDPSGRETADLRIGHMEASARVPVGGIDCAGAS
jgi:hypothetical protein